MAKLIQQRLMELHDAESLEVMRTLTAAHCHELSEDRKGSLAVWLVHPNRLVFRPNHAPVPLNSGGGLDWSKVTSIEVVEVVDYH